MRRRLGELDREDARAPLPDAWPATTTSPYAVAPPPRRPRVAVVPVVATLGVTGGLLWVRTTASEQIDQFADVIAVDDGRPPLPADFAAGRLLPAPAPPAGAAATS